MAAIRDALKKEALGRAGIGLSKSWPEVRTEKLKRVVGRLVAKRTRRTKVSGRRRRAGPGS